MHVVRGDKSFTVAEGHEWFWKIFADGSWEPSTFRIFDQFLVKDRPMLDIGAWIGPTALYAADKASKVFAFEPDTVAYRSLVMNIELNRLQNIIPYPIAVADKWKGIDFGPRTGYGDSMSSQLWGKGGDHQVAAASFESLITAIKPGFVKIDIEGGEKFIFEKAWCMPFEESNPTIHLSLHTPWHLDDLEGFKKAITDGIGFYPFFYDENLKRIELADAFNPNAFNSVVATYQEIA